MGGPTEDFRSLAFEAMEIRDRVLAAHYNDQLLINGQHKEGFK